MNFSYWERKSWLENIDFAVIGSGITGLSCALALRKNHSKSKIVVFEKGMLPSGASTKNAGFACFGSLSEILDDLENQDEAEVVSLIEKRKQGLQLLRNNIGDENLDYKEYGGYELFTKDNIQLFDTCVYKMPYVNQLLKPIFGKDVFSLNKNTFKFENIHQKLIYNAFEGQIDTGKMMRPLIKKASEENILILNNAGISELNDERDRVSFKLNASEEISAKKIFIATNGFAKQFLKEDVIPARGQVLITRPIENLNIKGTFHIDKGFYYFRNIDDRILFGGGRNLDLKTEETTEIGLTETVQDKLEEILRTVILPKTPFKIDHRWSGIMGVGSTRKPIVKKVSNNVYCGVRLGGMGVAIGSSIGTQLANLIDR